MKFMVVNIHIDLNVFFYLDKIKNESRNKITKFNKISVNINML